MRRNLQRSAAIVMPALALASMLGLSSGARAGVQLVKNGSFEQS